MKNIFPSMLVVTMVLVTGCGAKNHKTPGVFGDKFKANTVKTTVVSSRGWSGTLKIGENTCIKFPNHDKVKMIEGSFYNNNTIHVLNILYPNDVLVGIAASKPLALSSTPPETYIKRRNEEMDRIYLVESIQADAAKKVGTRYTTKYDYGSSIESEVLNAKPTSVSFPLERSYLKESQVKGKPVASMSIHRIFIRGLNERFELAVIGHSPLPKKSMLKSFDKRVEETHLRKQFNSLADEIFKTMKYCF